MSESIRLSTTMTASPEKIYKAWMSSKEHSAFTGGKARIEPKAGGEFSAWDGYIWGTTVQLEPFSRIVQLWRTSEFPEGSPDSRLEILLEPGGDQTRITLIHTNIPDGQGSEYEQGWLDYYFKPMKDYFS